MKFKLLFFMAFSMIVCACSKDDEPRDVNDSSVTINTNGTTSNGVKFSPIDATSFYLDYVKYEIVDSHIEIVGYDPIEISSEVVPYATIKIDGFTYNTRVIQDDAFRGFSKLEKFVIPNTIQTIGYNAFRDCSSLSSITFPESLTRIGDYAFKGCTSLSGITFPASLTRIGDRAFKGCSFGNVYLGGKTTAIDNIFSDFSGTLHVTKENYAWAKQTYPWRKFAVIVDDYNP